MLPTAFLEEIRVLLGAETDAFISALDQPAALALRINPLRPGAAQAAAPFCGGRVQWARDGYYLSENTRPGLSLAHTCGAFYMQEASAMISATVLDARPGEVILDLCAAPGGKTTQIAAAMEGRGLLVSNEPVPGRAKILAENMDRFGVTNGVAVCAYPDQLSAKWPGIFDAILVDAPCSGEGMFRREPGAREEWSPNSPAGCAKRQKEILDQAAAMLKPGGRLIYSTCTFNRTENEGSIEGFLSRHPEFQPEDFTVEGVGASQNGMLRLWPHRVRGDGHFVARLRRDKGPQPVPAPFHHRKSRPAAKKTAEPSPESLRRQLEDTVCRLPETLQEGIAVRFGEYLHLLPPQTPDLDGVRIVRPGLSLARVGRSHLRPMPQLAMAAGIRPYRTLSLKEDNARKFLSGEQLPGPEEKLHGWILALYENLPLGWTKLVDGMLKKR